MTVPERPDPSNRVSDRIASLIAGRIREGTFAEGERLPSERELALQFSASRTSVREAMLLLQSQGLLDREDRARARVTRPDSARMLDMLSAAAGTLVDSPEGIANLQEARAMFEVGLVRHAARHATPKQCERLALMLAENRKAIGNAAAFAETDMAFHLAIAAIPDNPIFVSLHGALSQWLLHQRLTGLKVHGSVRAAFRHHEAIYEAIAAHDVDGAEAAMANHLAHVARYFWKAAAA